MLLRRLVNLDQLQRQVHIFRERERPRLGGDRPHFPIWLWTNETLMPKGRKIEMDNTTIIRAVAAVLFVLVLVILIQRRRTRVK